LAFLRKGQYEKAIQKSPYLKGHTDESFEFGNTLFRRTDLSKIAKDRVYILLGRRATL